MTECEKLLASGFIKDSFLKEETICDYHVKTDLKKTWAILLNMLVVFDNVCKKNNLTYWLCAGSMLGAIRHHGFIPWDDDLDVMMPREDYDKLMTLSASFELPLFLQNEITDINYGYSFAKLRNLNTTCIPEKFIFHNMKGGIFLDIFPLDNFIFDDKSKEYFEKINQLNKDNSTLMRKEYPALSDEDVTRIHNLQAKTQNGIIDNLLEINQIVRRFQNKETDYYADAVCTVYDYTRMTYKKTLFEKTIWVDFAGFLAPAPIGYDEYLKTIYGDYTVFPPIEKRGLHHHDLYLDPDVPNNLFVEAKKTDILLISSRS